ncbi:hypothetical protein GPK34_00750 [Secundilactobacillus kimchicus]|uniref:hypothetical protein n=1 Tax=Secundilactobacillus kimchicus TaxID=528209 RepID=UPI001C02C787|nr:hypothetical protein [Secundilactobacillus kimchicus]MBT9670567.1 hypothetical protein [Secundilactobacillus kimchicus]
MGKVAVDNLPFRVQNGVAAGGLYENVGTPDNSQLPLLARVVSVDYEKGEVGYALGQDEVVQGYAYIPITDSGLNSKGKVYGRFGAISPGTIVLLAFERGSTDKAYIINAYAKQSADVKNYAPHSNTVGATDIKQILPSGQGSLATEFGNYTRTFNGGSFIDISDDELASTLTGVSYNENLFSVDGYPTLDAFYDSEGNPLDIRKQAQNWSLVHQSFSDEDQHRTMFSIDKFGTITGQMLDLDEESKSRLDLNLDNLNGLGIRKVSDYTHEDDAQDPDLIDSDDFAELRIDVDNNIVLTNHIKGKETGVKITPDGTYVDGVLVASQNNFEELTEEVNKVKGNLDSINSEITGLGSDFFTKLRTDLTSAQNALGKVQTNQTTANASLSDLQNTVGVQGGQLSKINTWQTEVNDNFAKLSGSGGTLDNLQGQITTIQNKLPTGTIITLDDVKSYNKSQNYINTSTLSSQIEAVKKLIPNAATLVSTADFNALKASNTAQESEIQDLKEQVAELKAAIKK